MKFAVTSDLHGYVPTRKDIDLIKACDALLIAGDVFEGYHCLVPFLRELKNADIPIIMTPGNHDFHIYNSWMENPTNRTFIESHNIPPRIEYGLEQEPYSLDFLKKKFNITVLIDQEYDLNGVKIYGTPWSPEFCRWAFMLKDKYLEDIFRKIPMDADILLSHSPPWINNHKLDVVLDMVEWKKNKHCGSKSLAKVISERPNLKHVFFGHIHSGDHTPVKVGNTMLHNVSYLNEKYQISYPLEIVEI